MVDQTEEILGFKIYSSEIRNAIIKFCGWTDVAKPVF